MQVAAKLKGAPISAQKCRLVIDQIRGKSIDKALDILTYSPKKAAVLVKKVVESAIANAENNNGADIDELKISKAYVDEGRTMKRWQARSKGRVGHILKRSCHITVEVSDE